METDAPDPIDLKLRWRQTWPDRESDFAATAPNFQGNVGRIYLHEDGPKKGMWFWAFQAFGDDISRNFGDLSGCETSARQAAKHVEDAWFAAINGSRYEVAQPSEPISHANAYATAKGR